MTNIKVELVEIVYLKTYFSFEQGKSEWTLCWFVFFIFIAKDRSKLIVTQKQEIHKNVPQKGNKNKIWTQRYN